MDPLGSFQILSKQSKVDVSFKLLSKIWNVEQTKDLELIKFEEISDNTGFQFVHGYEKPNILVWIFRILQMNSWKSSLRRNFFCSVTGSLGFFFRFLNIFLVIFLDFFGILKSIMALH